MTNYVPVLLGKSANSFSKERGLWVIANVDQDIG